MESLAIYLTLNSGAFLDISVESTPRIVSVDATSVESRVGRYVESTSQVLEKPLLINNPKRTTNMLGCMFTFVNKLKINPHGESYSIMNEDSKITQILKVGIKNNAQLGKRCEVFILSLLVFLCSFNAPAQTDSAKSKNFQVKTVVIDAGHGGHDPGCLGSSSQEKHVCLSVALKLGKLINAYFPDVKVIYTRDKDVFVKLYERAKIANKNKADLFISIHANSAQNKSAKGTETYVMGTKYTDRNLELTKRENSVILLEDDYEKNYDGYDPSSPMSNILMSLYQAEFLQSSINFASKVEHQFSVRNGRKSRGVRQRVLLVMYKTTMPSVLIELGFLTNLDNEKLLKDKVGQAETAGAIFRAFLEYKREMEGVPSSNIAIEEAKAFAAWDSMLTNVLSINISKDKVEEIEQRIAESRDSVKLVVAKIKETEKEEQEKKRDIKDYDLLFRVQITSSSKKIPLNSRKLKGFKDIFEYEASGLYRYAVGNCVTLEEAAELQKKVWATAFDDAFVVAFYKGERVSIKAAKELIAQGKQ